MNEQFLSESEISEMPLVCALIREGRAPEGLRMASALSLGDNEVEVLILGTSLPYGDELAMHLDSLEIEEIPIFAPFEDPRVQTITWGELAKRLETYDHVITF